MPVINRVAELGDEITRWRRDFHSHPELLYEVHQTAEKVANLLRSFGVDEVVTGIGKTGVVGLVRGQRTDSGKVIGLRADMDALPMSEDADLPYASKISGKMHACGHDGHTAMLLGAARYLCETRNFNGTAAVIFQPAEEGGAGARAMIDDGLMTRFDIGEVYGLHNYPGMPVGQFGMRTGTLLAAADFLEFTITGKGGHAAKPQSCVDPILAGAAVVQALQSFVSRNVDPLQPVVVSITKFNAGTTDNVIPPQAHLAGTVRSMIRQVGDMAQTRIQEIISQTATAYGCTARISYSREYPPTINHAAQTAFAGQVAAQIVGEANVDMDMTPVMGGEDFSFMLEERPGAFVFIGNGESAGLHHPAYDFNDAAIPYGVSYLVGLAQGYMPL
ncbi:MAG TPA: amidohydrolase [Rhizobiales bacterium]|nr:amidohydrolase [Hyphomicrobiales bacterium]